MSVCIVSLTTVHCVTSAFVFTLAFIGTRCLPTLGGMTRLTLVVVVWVVTLICYVCDLSQFIAVACC